MGSVIYFPVSCRACLGPDSPRPQVMLPRELKLVYAEAAHTHITQCTASKYIHTRTTYMLLPPCCHWQTPVCWCPREWESQQHSVIESLLPLCTQLLLSHCGNNLSQSISLLKGVCFPAAFAFLFKYSFFFAPLYFAPRHLPPSLLHFFQLPLSASWFPFLCLWACTPHVQFVGVHICSSYKFPFVHVCVLYTYACVSSVHWMTPQPVSLLHASLLFIVFLFVWLTCHPQKMFVSPRHSRLDMLAWSQPGLCLKKDRQCGSSLFIDSYTCSHSGDYVSIRRLTQGDQGLSSRTLSVLFVFMFSDWWRMSSTGQVRAFLESFPP